MGVGVLLFFFGIGLGWLGNIGAFASLYRHCSFWDSDLSQQMVAI